MANVMINKPSLLLAVCIAAFLPSKGLSWSSFTPSLRMSNFHSRTSHHMPTPRSTLSMKIKCALVGLPNVGKSTLFNAIAQKSLANAQNFPFCTIEPNITPIPIPDANLSKLATLAKSKKALPATITLVDVAGLVKGASRGEGLGNRFLATVRECDLIIHVVRNYMDDDVVHVDGKVDAVADAEVVNLELLLADLAHVQRRLERNTCTGEERDVLLKVEKGLLEDGLPARSIGLSREEKFAIKSMGLLTLKPVIYAFNMDEADFASKEESMKSAQECMKQIQYCDLETDSCLVVSAKLDAELGSLDNEEREEYLEFMDIEMSQLSYQTIPLLVKDVLDIGLVYTGPGVAPEKSQTTKTHIVTPGRTTALDFAGKLHGEISKGFMHAEVINSLSLIDCDDFTAAKESGDIRMEGKDYALQGDDVVFIKWK